VKNEPADLAAVKQLHGYVRASGGGGSVRGILVAPSIRTSALRLSRQLGLEFFKLDLRRYSMQRAMLREVQEKL
jgi:RecB family endonuclease NucS